MIKLCFEIKELKDANTKLEQLLNLTKACIHRSSGNTAGDLREVIYDVQPSRGSVIPKNIRSVGEDKIFNRYGHIIS